MPEFASVALTVILAPFFFAERTEATLTADAGAVAVTAVAVLNTGAVSYTHLTLPTKRIV